MIALLLLTVTPAIALLLHLLNLLIMPDNTSLPITCKEDWIEGLSELQKSLPDVLSSDTLHPKAKACLIALLHSGMRFIPVDLGHG